MEISDRLLCLYSTEVEEQDESYVLTVPKRELRLGEARDGETYRVALLSTTSESDTTADESELDRESGLQEPPVDEGDTRVVEIENLGEQGDGITRVERGYVVIVPDTETGERVRIEITDVQENVAFATVVERLSYYE